MAAELGEVARRYLEEVVGMGDLPGLQELVAPDCVWHVAPEAEPIVGVERQRQFLAAYLGLVGEIRIRVEDTIVEGNRVATRWTAREKSENGGSFTGMSMFRLENGKIAEVWSTWDTFAAMQAASGPFALDQLAITL